MRNFKVAVYGREYAQDAQFDSNDVEIGEWRKLNLLRILLLYLLIMNMVGLIVMGVDKSKAKCHAWRIPEKTLFLVSLLGGSIGTWMGMYLFRHKTKHWYFLIGMPMICMLHIVIAVYVFYKLLSINCFD